MHLGVDIHKAFCQTTMMDENGTLLRTAKIPTKRDDLRGFFGQYGGSKAVIESSTVWEFVYEVLEDSGVDVVLSNPYQTKAIAHARVKTDKVDSLTLAHLLRTGMIPESYIPPRETRELRKDFRGRKSLKDLSTSVKNQIYAELIRKGIEYPEGVLSSFRGMRWVEGQLPEPRAHHRLSLLKMLEEELDEYNRELLLPSYEGERRGTVPRHDTWCRVLHRPHDTLRSGRGDSFSRRRLSCFLCWSCPSHKPVWHDVPERAHNQGGSEPASMGHA